MTPKRAQTFRMGRCGSRGVAFRGSAAHGIADTGACGGACDRARRLCVRGHQRPNNQPITGSAQEAFASSRSDPPAGDDVLVGLAFSGGGTRAAAFAHGVSPEIDRQRCGPAPARIRCSTAWALSPAFRRRGHGRLLRPEEARSAGRFPRKIPDPQRRGGAQHQRRSDEPDQGAGWRRQRRQDVLRWLDKNLFEGATFADFRKTRARASGSTPRISTTARHSSTARRPSSRCAAILRHIRLPTRSRPRPRCPSCSRRR